MLLRATCLLWKRVLRPVLPLLLVRFDFRGLTFHVKGFLGQFWLGVLFRWLLARRGVRA